MNLLHYGPVFLILGTIIWLLYEYIMYRRAVRYIIRNVHAGTRLSFYMECDGVMTQYVITVTGTDGKGNYMIRYEDGSTGRTDTGELLIDNAVIL
jgi:hypothetical protein